MSLSHILTKPPLSNPPLNLDLLSHLWLPVHGVQPEWHAGCKCKCVFVILFVSSVRDKPSLCVFVSLFCTYSPFGVCVLIHFPYHVYMFYSCTGCPCLYIEMHVRHTDTPTCSAHPQVIHVECGTARRARALAQSNSRTYQRKKNLWQGRDAASFRAWVCVCACGSGVHKHEAITHTKKEIKHVRVYVWKYTRRC